MNAQNINELLQQAGTNPEQEPTAEQLFEAMTAQEQEGFIDYCVYVEGFNKALDEIPNGIYEQPAELIRTRFDISKQAPFYLLIMGYVAGIHHGFDLACKMQDLGKEKAAD